MYQYYFYSSTCLLNDWLGNYIDDDNDRSNGIGKNDVYIFFVTTQFIILFDEVLILYNGHYIGIFVHYNYIIIMSSLEGIE